MQELQSLQNAANDIGLIIHEKLTQDKRKKVKTYFANRGNETVSPVLDYNKMNHFLLGWRMSTKPTPKPYIILEIEGGYITNYFANQEVTIKEIENDLKQVMSRTTTIKPDMELDKMAIDAEEYFNELQKAYPNLPSHMIPNELPEHWLPEEDDWDGEQDFEFENGPTGHGDICHSDADSGL